MALSSDRIGEIAMLALQHKMETEGMITLNPKEIRRQIHNMAKTLGIPVPELAQFVKIVYTDAFTSTMSELDSMIPSATVAID
jgi:hypothetical protein